MTFVALADLSGRVVIEKPVWTEIDGGGSTIDWIPVATVWARIQDVNTRDDQRHDVMATTARAVVLVRFRADLDPSMRFRNGSRVLEIRRMRDPDGDRRWLSCECEERSS